VRKGKRARGDVRLIMNPAAPPLRVRSAAATELPPLSAFERPRGCRRIGLPRCINRPNLCPCIKASWLGDRLASSASMSCYVGGLRRTFPWIPNAARASLNRQEARRTAASNPFAHKIDKASRCRRHARAEVDAAARSSAKNRGQCVGPNDTGLLSRKSPRRSPAGEIASCALAARRTIRAAISQRSRRLL